MKEGEGYLIVPQDGYKYNGNFKNDFINGYGVMSFYHGDKY
jgi:hypothetical protein